MLDADLATIFGVTTKRFDEQVKRNHDCFPADFMFQLTVEEIANLKSQLATSSDGWGGRRALPYVFTKHGAVMPPVLARQPRFYGATCNGSILAFSPHANRRLTHL